jgi:hypothetical protein
MNWPIFGLAGMISGLVLATGIHAATSPLGSQYPAGSPQANAVAAARNVYPGVFNTATGLTVTQSTGEKLASQGVTLPQGANLSSSDWIVDLSGVTVVEHGPGHYPPHTHFDVVVDGQTGKVIEAYSNH